jgi:hypothetical protein
MIPVWFWFESFSKNGLAEMEGASEPPHWLSNGIRRHLAEVKLQRTLSVKPRA